MRDDRPLIQVDLPGFGAAAHLEPINRIEEFAAWVLSALHTQGVERFDLMGHSMGGMVAQDMVRQAPGMFDNLILYGTGPVGALPGRFETMQRSRERAQTDGARATARRISATWLRDGEASPEYPATSAIAERAGLPAILAGLEAMEHWSGEAHLPSINSRTLVLWGDLDRSYAWPQIERLWTEISGANLAVVPNAAHSVHSDAPEMFNALVTRFLSETA